MRAWSTSNVYTIHIASIAYAMPVRRVAASCACAYTCAPDAPLPRTRARNVIEIHPRAGRVALMLHGVTHDESDESEELWDRVLGTICVS